MGLQSCDAVSHMCFANMPVCSPMTCKGCCSGNTCFAGTDANDCGSGGTACKACASGLSCAAQQCVQPACGPASCAGCCSGAVCLGGVAQTACGKAGEQCTDCTPGGTSCMADGGIGGSCEPAKCSSSTCPLGCCDANGVCQSSSATLCGTAGSTCQICPSGSQCLFKEYCGCNSVSCPSGCCAALQDPTTGVYLGVSGCRNGTSDTECGGGGDGCQDCTQFGNAGTCGNQQCNYPPPCLCTSGCCDRLGRCQPGASNTQCGGPGAYCQDCTLSATQCDGQQCMGALDAGVCNAQTCPNGCCDSYEHCQQGLTSMNCGNFGTSCQSCQPDGLCSNQQCIPGPTTAAQCNPNNCNGCCDSMGNCINGYDGAQCGSRGTRCVDCTKMGNQCEFGSCIGPDGAAICSQTCAGCCDTNGNCQLGFASTQCGEVGAACVDCTALSPPSTCDLNNVSPRACASQQTQCPEPYPSCPTPLQQQARATQKVCSPSDLQALAAACSGGAYSNSCSSFFSFESGTNLACANCLEGFDYDFVDQTGVRSCVAPFVDATCNHNSACVADCVTESCYPCNDIPTTEQCETQVQTSTCAAYFQADQCVTQALNGPGAVCNPITYQGSLGAWLQVVGATYCGQ